jgi:small GTP-binding protein
VRVGESPVPGLTLRRILRGHTGPINHIAWSPDGRFLAAALEDNTIRIWDVAHGECTAVLGGGYSVTWSPDSRFIASGSFHEPKILIWDLANDELHRTLKDHANDARSVIWQRKGKFLASGSRDKTIRIWDTANGTVRQILKGHEEAISSVTWSPDDRYLASGSYDKTIRIWDTANGTVRQILKGHEEAIQSVTWSPDDRYLASGSYDKTIRIWSTESWQLLSILEGHTMGINSVQFSPNSRLLASKSYDQSVRLWSVASGRVLAILDEKTRGPFDGLVVFHPHLPFLATLGKKDTVIRIWDMNTDVLLSQTVTDSVRYTTAKLVLVGDSGVGKTGLGWRLAHSEFREHASTHGQQFWVIDELGTKRKDGTECEAVLWDLAGQHVYRPIHSIFLDNVDTSLVLFDPTNRQDPLKGAQFWLEQLKGKGQLPPSVLIGGRVDRGALAVSQQYLMQFCQRYGISGGYISTSAKSGEGLDELIKLLQEQIQWDKMTTTVTTVTFKRIKDYVLALKEKPDRQSVLVRPTELRRQLQATDPDWQFTDDEMMTSVRHLQTHGYVTILKSSSGETYILLTPDLLVDLASSIVLLADKHPRELGAVSETELLQGRYPFDELAGLEEAEQHILLEAAVLRFLEHNVCFRETFGNDTLLIFPGLIKQKRPLEDDFKATDDVSYIVRGRVENLYAMLVVLLGYTPSFIRINQWQNQAQYEMGKAEICGFRMIEDREGEIELLLYYSEQMPQRGRASFQELFERFLYQREVEVTRFPPVLCPEGHRLERATVISLIREGQHYAFCAKCGGKVDLPELDKPGIGTGASGWLQREEAAARLRSTYEAHLARVKGYRRGWATPRCYISRAPGQETYAEKLMHDLQDAGVYLIEEVTQLQPDDYVIVLDTPAYQSAYRNPTSAFAADVKLVKARLGGDKRRLISIKLEGKACLATPHDLRSCNPGDFCDATHYPVSLFNLVLELYAIPFTHAGFTPLRESLHQQWEQMLSRTEKRTSETKKRFEIALSFPSEHRDFVKTVADILATQLDRERVFYDAYHEGELARPDLDTYLQEIYHDQAELVVVFLCAEYEQKEWCGLEWRAVRDLLKQKKTAEIMPVRLDDTHIPGLFSIDGYINAKDHEPAELADLIVQRLRLIRQAT